MLFAWPKNHPAPFSKKKTAAVSKSRTTTTCKKWYCSSRWTWLPEDRQFGISSASHHNRTTKVSHSTMKHPAGFKFSSEFTLVVSSGRFFWRHSSMKSSKLRWHRFTSAMKSLKLASWSIDAVLLGKWSCLFCAINERHASTLHCCFMGARKRTTKSERWIFFVFWAKSHQTADVSV